MAEGFRSANLQSWNWDLKKQERILSGIQYKEVKRGENTAGEFEREKKEILLS